MQDRIRADPDLQEQGPLPERSTERQYLSTGLSGSLGKNALDICEYGVSSLMTTVNAPMSLDEALDRAEELYLEGAIRMFRFIKAGMDMR